MPAICPRACAYRRLVLAACAFAASALRADFPLFEPWSPRPVFFPPPPPIYGEAIPDRPTQSPRWSRDRRPAPPDGLAEFVADDFFPALSTRLAVPELNARLEARIRQYREKRQTEVQALLNEFVELQGANADERTRQLRIFAETQTPRLVALEGEADRLREDIITDGIFTTVDWSAFRHWKLGTLKSNMVWAEAEGEFQVIRASAYYQEGLLPAQRGLLREVALELQSIARKARGLPGTPAESDAMFFSPETTRFRLPPDLSSTARERIAAYNSLKTALKRELREAVVANDGASSSRRAEAFAALAEKQWPALKSLDALADEIRDRLAVLLEVTPPPPPPWLPAGLLDSINAYNRDRALYLLEAKQRVDSVVSLLTPPGRWLPPDERLQAQREYDRQKEQITERLTREFHEQHLERFQRLQARYEVIRQLLAVAAEKQVDRQTGRPLTAESLLHQYTLAMEEFAAYGRTDTIYTNYRLAMFQPGLSPEQRRLLFGHAWVGLAQPLPAGEFLPRRADAKPVPAS